MAAKRPGRPNRDQPKSAIPIVGLILGGGGLAIVFGAVAVFVAVRFLGPDTPPAPPEPPDPPVVIAPPTLKSKSGPWWEDVPGSKLGETVAQLRPMFPDERSLFADLGNRNDAVRLKGYQELSAKLSDLLRNPNAKEPVGRLVIDCYALESIEKNLAPLREWLVGQVPKQNTGYPAGYKLDQLDASLWATNIGCQVLVNQNTRVVPLKELSQDLGKALEFPIDPTLPLPELKARAEKLLALRCYNNLLPTADKSVEVALAIREGLIKKLGTTLSPTSREKIDVDLLGVCFPEAGKSWTAYRVMLLDCLKSENMQTKQEIVALYEQADEQMAKKLELVLATEWKECADAALTQDAKVRAMQRVLGILNPNDRLTRLENLTNETLARAKPKADEAHALLQETARLAHASTLACALFRKEFGLGRFDQLIAKVPELDAGETKTPVAKTDKTKDPEAKAKDPAVKIGGPLHLVQAGVIAFNSPRYPRRGGSLYNLHQVPMLAGRTYDINLRSPFDNYLYLENPAGQVMRQDDDSGGGLNARIVFTAPFNGSYRVIATSCGGGATGPYTLSVDEVPGFAGPGFGGPIFLGKRPFPGRFPPAFGPPGMFPPQPVVIPGQPPPEPKEEKPKVQEPAGPPPQVEDADVKNLTLNAANARTKALLDIADKLQGDLTQNDIAPRHAREIARYLIVKIAEAAKPDVEINQVAPKLERFAKSRNLMLALAEFVDHSKAKQGPTETVVSSLFEMKANFGANEWRPACRKLLLLQALELSGKNVVAQASDLLRDYYLEQGVLFGMHVPDTPPLARPTLVMDRLIKHLAAKLTKDGADKEHKEYLDTLPRQLLVAQATAQNDLEHTVMLQRIWFKVVSIHIERRRPQRANDLRQVHEELNESDRRSSSVLEQLRLGEEKTLKLWGLALDLK